MRNAEHIMRRPRGDDAGQRIDMAIDIADPGIPPHSAA